MYRQQSLIALEQFYEMKTLTKLKAILSFIYYLIFKEFIPLDSHKRRQKGYSKIRPQIQSPESESNLPV